MLQEKVNSAKRIVLTIADNYKNPLIYCGFGKDSMALLYLIREEMGLKWDIMCHREPEFPIKWRYAHKMMERYNLTCYDYPPRACSIFNNNGTFFVSTQYDVGNGDLYLPGILYEPGEWREGEFLCGLRDIYLTPKCSGYDYRWDVGVGATRTNESQHPHTGGQPIGQMFEFKQNIGSADFAYPLLHWTGQDVYEYHVKRGIPINTDVYEVKDGELVNKADHTFDPDWRPACVECMRPESPDAVYCPKLKGTVSNVSAQLVFAHITDLSKPDYKGE